MLQSRLRPLPRKDQTSQKTPTQNLQTIQAEVSQLNEHNLQDEEEDDDVEDIFSAFLPHLLPDDAPQFHGDPGQRLRYSSPMYGDLTIMVPHYPGQSENRNDEIAAGLHTENRANQVEEGRKLFAHFLWSAAMVVAAGVEDAAAAKKNSTGEDKLMWSVDGHRVLELGAGAGLPSVISVLSSASHVTMTDHPSSPAFLGAMEYNIMENVPASLRPKIKSQPHEWGVLDDEFALANKGRFSRIIAADCLWMLAQHANLAKTLLWFLSDGGRVWVVAGFHTGRAVVANFFETAVALGLAIERIYERDLNADAGEEGREVRREWAAVRADEGPENRKRWCVIAELGRS
ncbi:putative nicotinamide N-methyltransferase [Talaromyces proteolyticus]|uniref:Nicotinamide N-methyltransferase n=1 Tax=Talaromyces proteolyticus TaxID=1131652 RepID=A0AAD4KP66_9EURO|nr:putative nicotinamide N-methyltransferase [Talaromyces proteolyticus]KAH8692916.1 putative nicotinamide N-methyltransferase [Talaromyces proteolyticus]